MGVSVIPVEVFRYTKVLSSYCHCFYNVLTTQTVLCLWNAWPLSFCSFVDNWCNYFTISRFFQCITRRILTTLNSSKMLMAAVACWSCCTALLMENLVEHLTIFLDVCWWFFQVFERFSMYFFYNMNGHDILGRSLMLVYPFLWFSRYTSLVDVPHFLWYLWFDSPDIVL